MTWQVLLLYSLLPAAAPVEDFTFIHLSDMHLSHHHVDAPPPALRGAETIEWLTGAVDGPQRIRPYQVTTSAPSFAIATGDLTEYGVIDQTWETFEKVFSALPFPMYVVPGNHDNTWVAMYHIMRKRHGGENYSFDQHGCRFMGINSASPQEPVPTIDGKTRAWLTEQLKRTSPTMPVFIALHHPPESNEFAAPIEYDTLIDLLRDHNVALLLYGHGHSIRHRDHDGVDGVMGGSTFGGNSGYGVVSVQDGVLRVAYRRAPDAEATTQPAKAPWRKLLEKPLANGPPKRLFQLVEPNEGASLSGEVLDVRIERAALPTTQPADNELTYTWHIDGEPVQSESVAESDGSKWRIDISGLAPGGHLLTVKAEAGELQDLRTRTFRREVPQVQMKWSRKLPTAFKAAPLVAGELLIVADTSGSVTALDRSNGQKRWSFSTGGEILGGPAWTGSHFAFGSGDGNVYAIDREGRQAWQYSAGIPVYAPPLVVDEVVYIGDNSGRMHALDAATGKAKWVFSRAEFAIEAQACAWRDMVVFGAWDGNLYALDRDTGVLRWKSAGPKSALGGAARYYSPADCSPVVLGDRLFVCDRGYQVGMYSPEGVLLARVAEQVCAIAADGERIIARTIDDRLLVIDSEGELVSETSVPAGRFPVPPTVAGDSIFVCSNTGRLSCMDRKSAELKQTYRVTAGWYVMAPVAVDGDGVCYVAGMDGSLSAVRFKQ